MTTPTPEELVELAERECIAHADGSMTIDNASVQRLMDRGLLHYTNNGWIVGDWERARSSEHHRRIAVHWIIDFLAALGALWIALSIFFALSDAAKNRSGQ